ncbi:hypothetical protein C2S53_008497 [Perilla frutescens var. hirtella]|uniref:Uncharacterized protein n=1 Tax=Perilla frutescens var. hirtella TaxID=608512 RepID=A0AAD4JP91_PERFH|nr:hypothetical protein C2S53_008497 [Perilla frutescens var. hirtella]
MAFSSLNNFLDKRKPKKSEMMIVDESALAKSAAWAWYEHGSGSDGRSIREVDVWSSKMEPTPSRYKLEVLRNNNNPYNNIEAVDTNSTKTSLLDNYEIEMISKQLDQYIQATHAKYHTPTAAPAAVVTNSKVVLKKKIPPKGWFWSRHVPVCGSSTNDVVECRPEKGGVPVVGVVSCRPRPWAIRA